ncbi:MAG: YbjN domain-containing protein [Roseinatronobacter sp.]
MRHSLPLSALLFSSSMVMASPSLSQSMVTASDTDTILNIARGYGSATLEADEVGDPFIRGRIDGVIYVVNFYGCTNSKDCTTIQFRAAWNETPGVTLGTMNNWNRDMRFGKAYLDTENGPTIEWDVNLFGGVSATNLDDTFDWWKIILGKFVSEVM